MGRRIIINESDYKRILIQEKVDKAVADAVSDALKNDRQVSKDLEKKIRAVVANSVNTLFKTLWQRRNFYEDEIKRG